MPILISEMSMSMGMIKTSTLMELSEMSMSMGTIELLTPILISEMSLSMGTIKAQPLLNPTALPTTTISHIFKAKSVLYKHP